MAVPTEQEFIVAMEALAQPLPKFLIERFNTTLFLDDDMAAATALVREVENWDIEQLNGALAETAAKWLCDDPMIKRAYEAARKRTVGISSDEVVALMVKRFRPLTFSESYFRWVEVQHVADSFYKYARIWPLALLRAFHEYHYKRDTVRESRDAERELDRLRLKAIAGAEALRQIELRFLPYQGRTDYLHRSSREKIDSRFTEAVRRIDLPHTDAVNSIQPIRRNDATARERLLVFRIWQAHRAIFRHHKPRAIQIILLAEGVENQIDERGIERMCAGFKAEYKRPRYSNYVRELFGEIRGDNYRDEMRAFFEESRRAEELANLGPQLPLTQAN